MSTGSLIINTNDVSFFYGCDNCTGGMIKVQFSLPAEKNCYFEGHGEG